MLAIIRLRGLFEDKRNHAHIIPCVLLLCMHGHCLCCALCIADFCGDCCLQPGLWLKNHFLSSIAQGQTSTGLLNA